MIAIDASSVRPSHDNPCQHGRLTEPPHSRSGNRTLPRSIPSEHHAHEADPPAAGDRPRPRGPAARRVRQQRRQELDVGRVHAERRVDDHGRQLLRQGEPQPDQLRPADRRHRQARLPAVLRGRQAVQRQGLRVAPSPTRSPGSSASRPSEVKWTVEPFNSSYAPGPKKFDFDVNQISISPARAKHVDFSTPYYTAPQAVVALNKSERRQRQVAGRPQGHQVRRPDRHLVAGRGHLDDQAVDAAAGLQRLQRRRPRAEGRQRRRGRRRPPDRVLPDRRAGRELQDRRAVRRARRRHVGRAAGQGLQADPLRLAARSRS